MSVERFHRMNTISIPDNHIERLSCVSEASGGAFGDAPMSVTKTAELENIDGVAAATATIFMMLMVRPAMTTLMI